MSFRIGNSNKPVSEESDQINFLSELLDEEFFKDFDLTLPEYTQFKGIESQNVDKEILFKPTEKQNFFIESALSGEYNYLCYGGAIRGGKTYVTIAIFIALCKIYPGSRWVIVRKTLDVIKKNVLPTFFKLAPTNFLKDFNRSSMTALFNNKSEILFMSESYQEDKELNRFRGLEINGAGIEEANECQFELFEKLIERSGSWILPIMPKPLIILTCNPSQGWVKRLFYTPFEKKTLKAPYLYLPAYITDNPYLPADYLNSLFYLSKESYNKFVKGSWDATDDDEQLISWELLTKAKNTIPSDYNDGPYSMGVDVARFGKDRSVIVILKGFRVVTIEVFTKTDTFVLANRVEEYINHYKIDHSKVGIDVVGLGSGTYDALYNRGIYTQQIVGGSSSTLKNDEDQKHIFFNLNAQIGWATREAFVKGLVCGELDDELLTELAANRFRITTEKSIKLLPKDAIKLLLKISPDKADAFKYAIWMQVYSDLIVPKIS